MDKNIFLNPSNDYRIKPFWFWNGDMNEKEVEHQIAEMADKGVGGIFICARQGLKIPYLSQQWFERVRFAVETAKKYGLEVWLYDEYPYPSGISGGEVILQHPDAKQTSLVNKRAVVKGPQNFEMELPWAKVLYAKAVPQDKNSGDYLWEQGEDINNYIGNYQSEEVFQKVGLTAYNTKRYFTYGPQKKLIWSVPEGTYKITVIMEKEIEDFKYYGTYVDPCSIEAVETFINTTHQRYKEILEEYFGDTVKGMFTDEVSLLGSIPWTNRLREFFIDRNGYDLIEVLPALFESQYENTAKIRYDYYQSVHLLFRKVYHERISKWCEENNIMYATEVPSMRMTTQLFSHVPGCDSAHEKLGKSLEWILDKYTDNLRGNPKVASSLARQLGRKFAMVECFHSIGWSMTLQDAKWMIDRMAAFGINLYNFHAFFYTTDGLTKHDAPPSQFLQNPYWKHFKLLGDYIGRISYAISGSKASTEIAVLDPTTSLWTHLGDPFRHFSYGGSCREEEDMLETLKKDWVYICKTLLMNQIDFDHIDAEILSDCEIESGKFVIGDAKYSTIIIPPITNLESFAWGKIKDFIEAGGVVITAGLLPYEVIDDNIKIEEEVSEWFGQEASSKTHYWTHNNYNAKKSKWTKGKNNAYFLSSHGSLNSNNIGNKIVSLLDKVAPPTFKLEVLSGDKSSVLMHYRIVSEGSETVFISNQEGKAVEAKLFVKLDSDNLIFEEMNLEKGNISAIEAERVQGGWKLSVNLVPYGSKLFSLKQDIKVTAEIQSKEEAAFLLEQNGTEEWQITAEGDNIVRFGEFSFALDAENQGLNKGWHRGESSAEWPTVEAKTLIDQCSDLCDSKEFKLNFSQDFGIPMKLTLNYPMTCWYKTQFNIEEVPSGAKLLMDGGAISGEYEIYINGNKVTKDCFIKTFLNDQNNITSDIQNFLVQGPNSLVVRVIASKDWDGVIDPIYIAGSFGVSVNQESIPVITVPVRSAKIYGGYTEGYPYYAGTLSLKRKINVSEIPREQRFVVKFNNWDNDFHDCAEVLINGQTLGVKAWSPYLWEGKNSMLQVGDNEIEVKITNTLVGMLDGKYFDYEKHEFVEVKS